MDGKFLLDLMNLMLDNFQVDILVYIVHKTEVHYKIDNFDHYNHNPQVDKFYLLS